MNTGLASAIRRDQVGHADIQILPWDVDQVVSIRGSIEYAAEYHSGEGLLADMASALLDKGTEDQSKLDIAARLEDVGASISFSTLSDRLRFTARCLRPDLDLVLELIAEQLNRASFPENEFQLVNQQVRSAIQRQRVDPGDASRRILSGLTLADSHPGREWDLDEIERNLDVITAESLRAFHDRHRTLRDVKITLVGDVADVTASMVLDRLGPVAAPAGSDEETSLDVLRTDASVRHLEIADRPNLSVLFGHEIPVRSVDDDYLALWTAVFILGGNFSSRLMTIIRDEMGLTYGVRSALSAMNRTRGGLWATSITLSQDRLDEGVPATKDVINRFVTEGPTLDELNERKMTLKGSYQVELATTQGLAARMHTNMLRGYGPEMMDDHPLRIDALTRESVTEAARKWLHPDRMHVVSAGSKA